MKLNTRRTFLVGFAFMSIGAFWQMYDNVIQKVLKYNFGLGDTATGAVMALDNVLALFLLPFFGMLSDKTSTRFGKRTPYIVFGTLCAVVLMGFLPVAIDRQSLWIFMIVLLVLLVAMSIYRSPAVALMPDVTPKPLRSKGNAVINLMGSLGGVFTLLISKFLLTTHADGTEDYTKIIYSVAAFMVIAVIVLLTGIREKKLAQETAAFNDAYDAENAQNEAPAAEKGKGNIRALSPPVRKSLFLILFSVFFWFMGYNALTSAFSRYVQEQWNLGLGDTSLFLLVANAAALISFIPIGIFSSRFGRKRVIQFGVILLTVCFGVFSFYQNYHVTVYFVLALVGIAWASINVNSYPMVVEISKSGDIGEFTGYYYSFSMAAQAITPTLSGFLMEHIGYHVLAPYAAVMVAISLITITLTKHGDSKPLPPKTKLEAYDAGDD